MEVYNQDNITLHCGDNVEVMQQMPEASIDLVVTSPPYDNLRTYGGHSWDFEGVAQQLWRLIKPGGVVVWIVNDATIDGSETGTSFRQALRFMEIGFRLHDTMIWEKTCAGALGSVNCYLQNFEFMFVLSKHGASRVNLIADRVNVVQTGIKTTNARLTADKTSVVRSIALQEMGKRTNIWKVNPVSSLHPAPFPEPLARDHILSWSNEGDTVLDPFSGSGTTIKMARLMGRRGVGIEVNPEYCEIAKERLRQKVLF
jgi:DNA modification methylase